MVTNIIKSKGGLHNRITEKIQLRPFNLFETKMLIYDKGIEFTEYDIIKIYMALGGVPFYLEKIKPGESVTQALNRLCFSTHGFLRTEFNIVFASLFDQPDNHMAIIRTLAKVKKGLTRTEIMSKSKIKTGGTLTKTLTELEESVFLERYIPYQGRKDSLYRLSDEYSMFYLKFIENTKPSSQGIWEKLSNKQSCKIWSGFSFETICIKHIEQIKAGLNISYIHSTHGSWIKKNIKQGVQIDLLIDRDDNVINLCEMKFYEGSFSIDKKYADELINKRNTLKAATKTRKNIFITIITIQGLKQNKYSKQLVQNELNAKHLFKDT